MKNYGRRKNVRMGTSDCGKRVKKIRNVMKKRKEEGEYREWWIV